MRRSISRCMWLQTTLRWYILSSKNANDRLCINPLDSNRRSILRTFTISFTRTAIDGNVMHCSWDWEEGKIGFISLGVMALVHLLYSFIYLVYSIRESSLSAIAIWCNRRRWWRLCWLETLSGSMDYSLLLHWLLSLTLLYHLDLEPLPISNYCQGYTDFHRTDNESISTILWIGIGTCPRYRQGRWDLSDPNNKNAYK